MFDRIRKFLSGLRGEQAEEAVRQIPRPANMSRRGFFRAVGVTTATVVLGPSLVKACTCKRCELDARNRQAAIDAVNDFTRMKLRENGFYRRIMPPVRIPDNELDRSIDTDKPVPILKSAWNARVLQNFNEAIAKDYVVPFTLVKPDYFLPPHTCGQDSAVTPWDLLLG